MLKKNVDESIYCINNDTFLTWMLLCINSLAVTNSISRTSTYIVRLIHAYIISNTISSTEYILESVTLAASVCINVRLKLHQVIFHMYIDSVKHD